jgi:hypothetical protein
MMAITTLCRKLISPEFPEADGIKGHGVEVKMLGIPSVA